MQRCDSGIFFEQIDKMRRVLNPYGGADLADGVVQAGENPRVIEEKLKSFLAPADRANASAEGGEEVG